MMRLLKAGLIYGDLFRVDTPAMVERYNIALEGLTGRRTTLTDFMIDISGFAPEIGDEFEDPLYLNPNGCNRQFIILSTAQKNCPLVNAQFSTSHDILRRFIEDNESQLFALTARDAVAGELVNSVLSLSDPAQLFDIRKIVVEADTSGAHLKDAAKLQSKIEEFSNRPDAWWDDVLIADMITLSRRTGDVTRNPIMFSQTTYEKGNFFTEHFGGIYAFRDLPVPAAITRRPKDDVGKMPVANVLGLNDRRAVVSFLAENELTESIVDARGLDTAALLRDRLEFIAAFVAASAGEVVTGLSRAERKAMHRRHLRDLGEEYTGIFDILRWLDQGGRKPRITADHGAAFYTLRARRGPEKDLVNMLLAELCPLDFRQLYICNKPAFYAAYQTWPDTFRDYVVDVLLTTYVPDKAAVRADLFGDGSHDAPQRRSRRKSKKPEVVTGPWGPYER